MLNIQLNRGKVHWVYTTMMLFLFLYVSNINFGQLSVEDSIKTETLLKEALGAVYSSPKESKGRITQNLTLVKNSPYLTAKSYNYLGICYDVLGNNDSAIINYRKALNIAKHNLFKGIEGGAKNNLGLIHWNKANYDSAIIYFNESIILFEELNQTEGVASTLNNLGLIYIQEKRYDEALEYHKKALKNYLKIENTRGESASLANIGNAFACIKLYDSSFLYLKKAIGLKEQINDQYGLGLCYLNIGKFYNELANCDSSFVYNLKAKDIFESLNSKNHLAQIYLVLAEDYECFYQFNKADVYYEKAEKLAIEVGNRFTLNNLYRDLNKSHAKRKNWQKAHFYSEKHRESSDSIFSEEKSKAIAEIQERYESAKKDKEIADKEMELIKEKSEKKEKDFFLLLSILGSLGMLVLVISIYGNAKRKHRELKMKAELDSSKERLRISRDLHDHIGAELTLVKSKLDQRIYKSNNKEDKESLEEISNYAKVAIDQLRKTIWATKSEEITLDSFVTNLTNYIKRYDYTYSIHQEHDNKSLSSTVALNLFRVCQESINNSIKYSSGNNIDITIKETQHQLTITLKDNGKGFNIEKVKKGYGLENMSSRMEDIGGSFNIIPSDKGTITTLTI